MPYNSPQQRRAAQAENARKRYNITTLKTTKNTVKQAEKEQASMENERILELLTSIDNRLAAVEEMLTRREQDRERYHKRKEREEQEQRDKIGQYLREIFTEKGQRIKRGDLYAMLNLSCQNDGIQTPNRNMFYKNLKKYGYSLIKTGGEFYVYK